MTKPLIRIHNIETDEILDREMTDAEYEKYLLDKKQLETAQAEAEAKEAARQEILDRLGLTAEEAKILLG